MVSDTPISHRPYSTLRNIHGRWSAIKFRVRRRLGLSCPNHWRPACARFSAPITNLSFAFDDSWLQHFSTPVGLGPLFSTMPTNNGTFRYSFIGHFLLHLLYWCILAAFCGFIHLLLLFFMQRHAYTARPSFVTRVFSPFTTQNVTYAPSQRIGHEILLHVFAILIEGLMRCVDLVGFLTTVRCFLFCLYFLFVGAHIMGMHTGYKERVC